MEHLYTIVRQFHADKPILQIEEYGSGNVNDTYRVTFDDAKDKYLILQRINTHVFRRPELIMLNLQKFSQHVGNRFQAPAALNGRRWQVPQVIATTNGASYHVDANGSFWRALSFIDHSRTFNQVRDAQHAFEVGYALGKFHMLISDLGTDQLYDTLEGFHITPSYLQHFDEVLARCGVTPHSPRVADCLRFIETHRRYATALEDAKARNQLRLRPIHGDPKVNNIMIDDTTGQAVSMIDLDTVKPGLVHYDIGDCLRSCCNPLGEETTDFDAVRFDLTVARAVLRGYFTLGEDFLDANDFEYLFEAIRLLPFELGLRFFTDYLEGNVYFKTKHSEHNLHRANVQFELTASIEAQENEIRAMIRELTYSTATHSR